MIALEKPLSILELPLWSARAEKWKGRKSQQCKYKVICMTPGPPGEAVAVLPVTLKVLALQTVDLTNAVLTGDVMPVRATRKRY